MASTNSWLHSFQEYIHYFHLLPPDSQTLTKENNLVLIELAIKCDLHNDELHSYQQFRLYNKPLPIVETTAANGHQIKQQFRGIGFAAEWYSY
jgi:hypothetical protein